MRSTYFVPSPYGVEDATENELVALGAREIETRPGGVRFKGDRRLGYAANLWLRSGIRVQDLLFEGRVDNAEDLYAAMREVEWSDYMRLDQTLAVDASVNDSELRHSKYAALVVKDAIVDQFRERHGQRPDVDRLRPDLPLKLVVDGKTTTLWRNLSGPSLHKRGYRDIQVKSPLNEALAAGLLLLSGWDRSSCLVDPMCGSGTFLIEAALLATDRAPGLLREHFACEAWPDCDHDLFRELRDEARARALATLDFDLLGADRHGGALEIARHSARRAGVQGLVRFEQKSTAIFRPRSAPSHVVTNPPYGERLGAGSDLVDSWRELGTFLHRCAGARAWVLCGNPKLTQHLGLKASQKLVVRNSGIECRWLEYEIEGKVVSNAVATRVLADPAGVTGATEAAVADDARDNAAGEASLFVRDELARFPEGGLVLDLACGSGRHSRLLIERGFHVVALDRDVSGLGLLAKHKRVEVVEHDLEKNGWPFAADRRFDAIVVTRYLWRPLFKSIVAAVAPGGFLVYETFQRGQEAYGRPSNPDFLLRPNELLRACLDELVVLRFEAGIFDEGEGPSCLQRICAQRPVTAPGAEPMLEGR